MARCLGVYALPHPSMESNRFLLPDRSLCCQLIVIILAFGAATDLICPPLGRGSAPSR